MPQISYIGRLTKQPDKSPFSLGPALQREDLYYIYINQG